ncbi:3-isopropylmalate dehydratase small subunit [uncultured Desulfobacter sp.]|uniref:3-isopropylmalate dehydratase small subunit n=1 Tax=uncultured Desulfobacter sp. TaxID=240139 RepID=UPI0029F5B7F0|nr:3-isopropylmalate dehydratase small subunit [uncultured Desulfobacter sp.]
MKDFKGKMLCLDRADINTDEIIPAKYLTEIAKSALKPHLLEDLILDGFNSETDLQDVRVIVTRSNFGCGSSREHAPWALEENGINVVIAPSFARIFRQNMFNCGMMAIELPEDKIQTLFELGAGKTAQLSVDVENQTLTVTDDAGNELKIDFPISQFDKTLVETGGWVEFADKNY